MIRSVDPSFGGHTQILSRVAPGQALVAMEEKYLARCIGERGGEGGGRGVGVGGKGHGDEPSWRVQKVRLFQYEPLEGITSL